MGFDKCRRCDLRSKDVRLHPSDEFYCPDCAKYNDECLKSKTMPNWRQFLSELATARSPSATGTEPSSSNHDAIGALTGSESLNALSDLQCCDDPPSSYLNSLNLIYSYNANDVERSLDKLSLDHLRLIYNALWDKMKITFHSLKNSRPKQRQAKHTIIPDIYNFGLSLVNGLLSKDIDKVYAIKEHDVNSLEQSDDPVNDPRLDELVKVVMVLQAKVASMEKVISSIKQENVLLNEKLSSHPWANVRESDAPVRQETQAPAPARQENQALVAPARQETQAPAPVRQEIQAAAPARQETQEDVMSNSDEFSDDESDNNEYQLPASYMKKLRRLEKRVTSLANKCDPSNPPVTPAVVSVTQPKSRHTPTTGSRVSAPVNQHLKQLYIGGSLPDNTADFQVYLKSVGIHSATDVSQLFRKDNWSSYKVSLSPKEFEFAMEQCRWSTGIRIRPFRAKPHRRPTTNQHRDNSVPNNRQQGRGYRPSDSYDSEWPAPSQASHRSSHDDTPNTVWGRQPRRSRRQDHRQQPSQSRSNQDYEFSHYY